MKESIRNDGRNFGQSTRSGTVNVGVRGPYHLLLEDVRNRFPLDRKIR